MDERQKELSNYRLQQAEERIKASKHCFENGFYKDSISRVPVTKKENVSFYELKEHWGV